jgi:RsiW-degrading membrane proteinase PrsW (M82 family)
MMLLSLAAVAIAPALALGLFFYLRDRYKKEPFPVLLLTFALGAVVLVPSAVTSFILQQLTGWTSAAPSLLARLIGALLIVALVEESWKFLVVRLYAYARPEFDEPYDGIIYSVVAALGFATIENLLYVLPGGFGVGMLRALMAVPGHAFYGVLMGFFLGEAKFAATPARSTGLQLAGLGLAILAHGVYDFIIFALDQRPLLILVLPVYAGLTWAIFFSATRRQAAQSFRRHPELSRLGEPPGPAGPGPRDD